MEAEGREEAQRALVLEERAGACLLESFPWILIFCILLVTELLLLDTLERGEDEEEEEGAAGSCCLTPREVSDWYLEALLSSGGRCSGSMCSLRRSLRRP